MASQSWTNNATWRDRGSIPLFDRWLTSAASPSATDARGTPGGLVNASVLTTLDKRST